MRCEQCGKEITSKPCSYCGGEPTDLRIRVGEDIGVRDEVEAVTIKDPSEVTIEKDEESYILNYPPGKTSHEIVAASLLATKLSGVTPQYIQNQIINNVNAFEQDSQERLSKEITTEHSFTLGFPNLFTYRYTRMKTKKV